MSNTPTFLQGGGQMGELIRSKDWSQTALGSPDTWPDSLRAAISISLNSGFPIAIYWGNEFLLLYNDAWSSIPGNKHPWALGKPGTEVWPEIWDGLDAEFKSVLVSGISVRQPDALLLMNRYGYVEECYFDYTLSPIMAVDGSIGGIFNAVIETSYRVINDRRNKLLHQLLKQLNQAHGLQEAIVKAESILSNYRDDIPFYLLFSTNDDIVKDARLTSYAGITSGIAEAVAWPYEDNLNNGNPVAVNLNEYLTPPVNSTFAEPCSQALIVSISRDEAHISGYMVMGISPRKKLDADYEHFLSSVGLHVGTILNNGYNYEQSDALLREQALNEELSSANEELSSTNEELHQLQLNLANLNAQLEQRVAARTQALAASESRFRNLIVDAPVAIMVLNSRSLVVESANTLMLKLLGKTTQIIGMPFASSMPELEGQPFLQLLDDVYTTGNTYYGNEVKALIERNGELITGYYNFVYQAAKDENEEVKSIIIAANNVTEQVASRKRIEESESNLRSLVMSAHYALMVLRGKDWVIEIANQPLVDLWDKTIEEVTGFKLLDILPEIADQPFPKLLKQVYETGKGYGQEEEVFYLETPTGRVTRYVSFYYDPMFDSEGNVTGIIVAAEDITPSVQNRLLLEQSYSEQQALNEELSATNEELASANEELLAINEELAHTKDSLQEIVSQLAASENRLRYMLADAPVAIALLTGRDLIVEAANKKVLEAWGKNDKIIGLPLQVALPELAGQVFITLLNNVFISGEAYHGNEVKALLEHNGVIKDVYFNFVYHPLKDDEGQTESIVVVANDVTEQVKARRKVEEAEEMQRFSIEAARMGTWFLDADTRKFIPSPRLKELFGFNATEEVSYDAVVKQIPEEYRNYIETEVEKAVSKGEPYSVEHPVIGFHDQKLRWLKALGKLNKDSKNRTSYFSGVLLDITEQKQDEQRKNDFIGMVSHELKTPLTSLSAYVQMLHAKAKRTDDSFSVGALDKVNIQVKKMSTLINGFLNVSRLESGKIHLNKQDFRLDELISEMVEETRQTTSGHEVTLLPREAITVTADQDKIGSVISNLLSNAVKYSPRGTNITVNCEIKAQMAVVSVKDEGLGIKPQDVEKLFERYYRVDSKQTQTISGFGIGLYLCAEIIQRHDGKIWVESEPGEGSTFYFSLPQA
ncbi:ATP-binding protein [Mucilaginibacter terrae]|uniref:ATP-binding protein n=1 Tax=Mucilaginibacter terrae TaxID=1955052 RepID=UPI0036326F52